MSNSTISAAKHFIDLYSEEIEAGEVTADVVYEWWTHTKEQYPSVEYNDVETLVLSGTVGLFPEDEAQAVCESEDSDKVVKFVPKNDFKLAVQKLMNAGSVWGVFYNEEGKILAKDIWGDIHEAL